MLLDGVPVPPGRMAALSAHVPQHDLLLRSLTVEECLRYSAAIRLDARVPPREVAARVEAVMQVRQGGGRDAGRCAPLAPVPTGAGHQGMGP